MRPIKVAFIGSRILPTMAALFNEFGNRYEVNLDLLLCSKTREALLDGTEIRCPNVKTRIFKGIPLPLYSEPGITYNFNPAALYDLTFNGYDLFILGGYYLFSTQAALLFSFLKAKPCILMSEVHGHGRVATKAFPAVIRWAFVEQIIKFCSAHVAISSWAMNYLVRYGADPNGIFVIPYIPAMPGISMPPSKNEKSVLRKQYGLAEDTPVILWVGRMIPRKRLDDLFSAIVMLGRATDVQVVIVGSGPEEEALRGMQKRMMLDNVHFVGPKSQKDLPGFYRMADVFVYPSSDEPFGAVIPEAMTFGLPIVTTDVVGGSADFVIDGQNGFIVPHGKVLSLSRALSQILTDEQLRYRMGVESLKIMGRYSIEKNVTTLMDAINYALEKKNKRLN